MAGYFSPITPADRAFMDGVVRAAVEAKGAPLTREEQHDALVRAGNQLKARNASLACRAESALAGEGGADFTWQPRRPFRR